MDIRRSAGLATTLVAVCCLSASPGAQARQAASPGTTLADFTRGLKVVVEGDYPDGYKPSWQISENWTPVTFATRNFIVSRPLSDRISTKVVIGDFDGRSALLFNDGNADCVADIVGAPAMISDRPRTFSLTNFRRTSLPIRACASQSRYFRSWGGSLTLSADAQGDVIVGIQLTAYSDVGQPSMSYALDNVAFPNLMTAQAAHQKVAQIAQAAKDREAAQAEWARQAERQRVQEAAEAKRLAAAPKPPPAKAAPKGGDASKLAQAKACFSFNADNITTTIQLPNYSGGNINRRSYTEQKTYIHFTCGARSGFTHLRASVTLGVQRDGKCEKSDPEPFDKDTESANFVLVVNGYDNLRSLQKSGYWDCVYSVSKWEYNNDTGID